MASVIRAILLLGLLPAAAAAQIRDYFAFRDSLAQVTDVGLLHRMQARLATPGAATSAGPIIERGLIRIRVYELSRDRSDGELAREVFERGAERFGEVVWVHYGLALALAGSPEVRISGGLLESVTVGQSLAEILGKDPRSRARASALRALELDPAFGAAAVLLARLSVEDGRDRDALLESQRALERVRGTGGDSPDVARALSDVQNALGEYGAAETTARSGSGPLADHARAVALLLQVGKETEGEAAYFAAVDRLDDAAADRLYRDVEPIVNPAEQADWRVADLAGRRQWLHRFWSRRAAEAGIMESERLAEHYRRLALARRDYLRNSRRGISGSGVLLSESWVDGSPFDDRGLVLLKRGVPVRVVQTRVDGLLPNESWVYGRPSGDGNLLFHFVALRGSRDYSLVSDLLQALDPSMDPVYNKSRFDPAVITLIEDRAAYEPGYQTAAGRLRSQLASPDSREMRVYDATEVRTLVRTAVERVDADYRREARIALAEDVHSPRFDRAMPFHFDLFTFRAPFGRTDLTAAFAVPSQFVAGIEENGQLVYPVGVSVILVDTLIDAVTRRDTVLRVVRNSPLPAGEHLRVHVTFPVIPSEHTVYRVVARSPAIGTGSVYAGSTRLRDYSALDLQVSDLVLAAPDSAGDWARGDLRLALTLPRRFVPGRPFTLFYEVYNLERDSPYRTELRVDPVDGGGAFGAMRRLFGGGPPHVDLRFEDRASPDPEGILQEVRDLGTELPPGRYRMRITVTHARTGARTESETIFEVVR